MLLNNKNRIQKFANRYLAAKDVFFIGRGIDYAISLEGSLKLKEISYIHSEAYAAGELKHGTISLIEEGTLVAAVLTQEDLYKKMISNMVEVRTRGAFVLAVTNEGNREVERAADYVIYIPQTNRYFTNSLAIIPFAAVRILYFCGTWMRCGQTAESREISDSGIRRTARRTAFAGDSCRTKSVKTLNTILSQRQVMITS